MTLIIVESPTKARTITRFLGSEYTVKASMGHVRDLPEKATDIPAKYKKEKWARLGVDVAHDFAPLYVVSSDKKKTIKELKDLVAKHNDVILATDEDREGEAISWHLSEVLGIKSPKRIVFHEITKDAIQNALQNPRKIDLQVVQAQETRRILDRLVGYTISPLLWKKIKFGLSAGRVQSVAMRLIVNREKERMDFKKAGYHAVHATLLAGAESFKATLTQVDGKRIAIGKDFDERGQLTDPSCTVLTASDAKSLSETMQSLSYTVTQVTTTRVQRVPPPPYITSSLQIEANRKLGFNTVLLNKNKIM
jgi:DNA topoisomerase-1